MKQPHFFILKSICSVVIATFLFSCQSAEEEKGPAYIIENIELPSGLTGEVGGLDFLPNGQMVVCFHRGEVMIYDPESAEWSLFATGLHDPLGIRAISNSEVIVMQQPELTRLLDTDGDGMADKYKKITDDFGISGNYHEFNYGPVIDEEGSLYFALNTASSGAWYKDIVRGEINPLGMDGEDGRKQMYSVVPYRGWMMKVNPDGEVIPYASGLRSPNGLGFDGNGNLWVADNQGDWVSTSALYHIEEGHFYGHPASLVWQDTATDISPFDWPIDSLNEMRTKAAVLFPQGILSNSPSEPIFDAGQGTFGPYGGQMFIGEMNRDRILRVMLEEVNGEFQGAAMPFIDHQGLRKGNNRLVFGPDGSLYVGQTEHGWAGDKGIQKITYTGRTPMDVYTMKLTDQGFDLTFTLPLDETHVLDTANYHVRHYYYDYYKKEVTEPVDKAIQIDVQRVPISQISLSDDKRVVSLKFDKLRPGYIYELKLGNLMSETGVPLANHLICYTLNQLLDGEKME